MHACTVDVDLLHKGIILFPANFPDTIKDYLIALLCCGIVEEKHRDGHAVNILRHEQTIIHAGALKQESTD